MKRAVTFIFLLLANIALLAHAVVPHHHHGGSITFILCSHCNDCGKACHHNHEAGQHDDSTEDCPLKEGYIRADSCKQVVSADSGDDTQLSDDLPLFYFDSVIKVTDCGYLHFRQKPYLFFYHTTFISEALGLRAPPVC